MDFSFPALCALLLRSRQRETRHTTAALLFAVTLYDLYELLPKQDETIIYDFIIVVMAVQPVMKLCLLFDFLQKICQMVVHISTASNDIFDAAGGTVGDHIIHLMIDLFQVTSGLFVLCLAGQFFLPPGSMIMTPILRRVQYRSSKSGAFGFRIP